MRIFDKRGSCVFENLHREVSADRREVLKEHFKRIASFKVLEKNPHGDPCAHKDRGPAHDLRV